MNKQLELIDYLFEILGEEKAIKFILAFSGQSIYVPKRFLKDKRNTEIIKDYKNGLAIKELIRKYNITESHLRLIIKTFKKK